jgi:predicted 2-oxoglutarate/Fe(II)-dependent dioxygenase YbiX/peroxiredoxin
MIGARSSCRRVNEPAILATGTDRFSVGAVNMLLAPGDSAPWFSAPALAGRRDYRFDTVAGRPILLLFHGSAAWPASAIALAIVERYRAVFDDDRACFFGVSIDPADAEQGRIAQQLPGIRWFLDYDGAVARQYGAAADEDGKTRYTPQWILLDAALRVVSLFPIDRGEAAIGALEALIAGNDDAGSAPVLIVPRILDPALCRQLIDLYEADGGTASGFMREEDGITVARMDFGHKRRSDWVIRDPELLRQIGDRLTGALRPMIQRAFQFDSTRIERWLVACYNGDGEGGHFRAHRDNTTKGTAHRRFAVTINLNAEDYEGGDLRFPEFGPRRYRAPTGGAAVFSCSLLHEALPVTRGKRYAFLPFLYDDAAARLRERNLDHVSPELQNYRSGLPPEGALTKNDG